MPTLTRPGVYIDTSSFPTYVSATPGTAAAAFCGPAPRGPVVPTKVDSWRDFTAWFGGFETSYPPSNLHLAVYTYFSAGGTSATIIRAIRLDASGPIVATHTFSDKAATPLPTLKISAANPGAWGNNIYIDILAGTILDATQNVLSFTIQVKYQGSQQSNLVERWENLSMVPGSTNLGQNNYAPEIINSSFTGSKFITVQDMNSTSVPPADNPAVTSTPVQLTAGSDGSPITFTDQLTALQQLDKYPDTPFIINMPGYTTGSDISNVVGYAQTRGNGFVVIDCPPGMSPASMVTYTQGLPASAQAAVYYPQVQISDPYSPQPGRTRMVPPGGFIVGLYVSTDASRGVAKAPAGMGSSLLGAYGLEYICTNTDQGTLTQANVNCIISVPGSGVICWGARTLSPYLITRYVPVERSLIYLSTQMVALTKFAVFEPNDWILWNQITSILTQFLDAFWQSGGLQGQSAAQAYYVLCDSSNNPQSSIQQGIVHVEVGVALQFPAEFVVISIGQWAGGQTVTVTT
jgi:phage tail sheath protein FI